VNYKIKAWISKLKGNPEKVKLNKPLSYLVRILLEFPVKDIDAEDEESGRAMQVGNAGKGKAAVVKTCSCRLLGLVDPTELKPNVLAWCHQESYLVLEKPLGVVDSKSQAMEINEKPNRGFSDDKQSKN